MINDILPHIVIATIAENYMLMYYAVCSNMLMYIYIYTYIYIHEHLIT